MLQPCMPFATMDALSQQVASKDSNNNNKETTTQQTHNKHFLSVWCIFGSLWHFLSAVLNRWSKAKHLLEIISKHCLMLANDSSWLCRSSTGVDAFGFYTATGEILRNVWHFFFTWKKIRSQKDLQRTFHVQRPEKVSEIVLRIASGWLLFKAPASSIISYCCCRKEQDFFLSQVFDWGPSSHLLRSLPTFLQHRRKKCI